MSKSQDPASEWTTCRVREWVNDRKERWKGEIGNQFGDLLWSSGEERLGWAEAEMTGAKERLVIVSLKGVRSCCRG